MGLSNPFSVTARVNTFQRNLVYADTSDEKVYLTLSQRMRDRYDLFGSLPETIEDEWIEDIEILEQYFSQFTQKKRRATAFDLRDGKTVMPEGPGWERCEKVLSRRDVMVRLSAVGNIFGSGMRA